MTTRALDGRLAVVTGATSPIGADAAARLARAGAEVVRVAAHGAAGIDRLADPGDLASIDRLADALLAEGRPIDILVAADEIGPGPLRQDAHGVEAQMAHNALADAVLVSRLAPVLRTAEAGRFVTLASVAHQLAPPDPDDLGWRQRPYDPWHAYAASKVAAGLVALQVYRAFSEEAYSSCAVDPGCLPASPIAPPASLSSVPACDDAAGEGGAALLWAASAPETFARYSYADRAGPSTMLRVPNGTRGHMPFIGEVELADRLWAAFERHLGRALPLG